MDEEKNRKALMILAAVLAVLMASALVYVFVLGQNPAREPSSPQATPKAAASPTAAAPTGPAPAETTVGAEEAQRNSAAIREKFAQKIREDYLREAGEDERVTGWSAPDDQEVVVGTTLEDTDENRPAAAALAEKVMRTVGQKHPTLKFVRVSSPGGQEVASVDRAQVGIDAPVPTETETVPPL